VRGQLGDQPGSGGDVQAGAPRDLGDGQGRFVGGEGGDDPRRGAMDDSPVGARAMSRVSPPPVLSSIESSFRGQPGVGDGRRGGSTMTLTNTRDVATLRVHRKFLAADGVVTLEPAAVDGGRLKDWTPGSHIDLVLPGGLTRQYSLCGNRWDPTHYRLGILREPGGRGGPAYVHDKLDAGDEVGVGGPRNNFPLVPSPKYLFIAGGIGITPLLPMVHQAELLGAHWQLLYGGRHRAAMAFVDDLAAYGDRVLLRPQDEHGLLDLAGFLGDPRPGVKIYACGPAPLLDAIERICAASPPHTLHTERLTGDSSAAPARAPPCEVELARSGVRVTRAARNQRARRRGRRGRRSPVFVSSGHLRHVRNYGARRPSRTPRRDP